MRRENQEISIPENKIQGDNTQSAYQHCYSLSGDSCTNQTLQQLKIQNDLQRVQPTPKKKSLIQKIKQLMSNQVNWQDMSERNIIFNASVDNGITQESPAFSSQTQNQEVNGVTYLSESNENNLKYPLINRSESSYESGLTSGNRFQKEKKKIRNENKKQNQEFCSNVICTSKYTLMNFIFLNMYEQFTKVANLYFLVMGIFQMVPAITSSDGIPYVYMPLTFIIIVTAIKDIVEDIRRHQSDSKENNYPIFKYENGEFVQTQSKYIKVGDIVKITQNHSIVIDLVLLYSSTQNAGNFNQARKKGVCYIETKNLDGETSLKSKNVSKSIQQAIDSQDKIFEYEGLLKSEAPNPYLYKYSGSLKLFKKDKSNKDFRRIHIEEDNFVLRGCILRNTEYIIGVATFTGHETKIMLNSNRPRAKKSKVELDMNKEIMLIWLSQMIFCIISSFYGLFWYIENKDSLNYLVNDDDAINNNFFVYLLVRYGNWLIIFMNFVPISLLITLDVIRISQAFIIMKSRKMISFHKIEYYDNQNNIDENDIISEKERKSMQPQSPSSSNNQNSSSDKEDRAAMESREMQEQQKSNSDSSESVMQESFTKIHPIVQSSNLNEDLGQIRCVFSDKTGTLTCNVMNLKAVIFNGKIYGQMNDEKEEECELNKQKQQVQSCIKTFQQKLIDYEETSGTIPQQQKIKNVNFSDQEFVNRVNQGNDQKLQEFIEHLAICHTVMYQEIPISQMYRNTKDQQKITESQTKNAARNEGSLIKTPEKTIGTYQSASPDELALVNFAKMCGVEFKGHDENENIAIQQKIYQQIRSKTTLDAPQQQQNKGSLIKDKQQFKEQNKNFKLLQILHFTSERKRMSVIIENSQGQIVLLVKGADQVIVPKLQGKQNSDNTSFSQDKDCKSNQFELDKIRHGFEKEESLDDLQNNLHIMSEKGLRTLVMAKRDLDKDYYDSWHNRYEEAQNIVGEQKDVQLNNLMDEIEQNLTLLGATGIEDKLQKDVQDTIVSLKSAGITVWILTGDKRETAINIALSSRIVESEKVIEIYDQDIKALEKQLLQIKQTNEQIDRTVSSFVFQARNLSQSINKEEDGFESSFSSDNDLNRKLEQISSMQESRRNSANGEKQPIKKKQFKNSQKQKQQQDDSAIKDQIIDSENNENNNNSLEFYMSNKAYSLVIEGYSLDLILNADENIQKLFQDAIKQANSIVACRVSPKQKQQLVHLYKSFFPKHRTLAIGDGANDVNMLTEAHVGIGLEGLQAARASDYAIGEFRLLKRLLLVHGRECYRKNSTVILYNFYKNIVYLIPLFWFGIYSGFSGSFIYDQFLYQCFNTFFTCLPIVIYAVLDKDLSQKVLLTVPYFYRMGIQNRYFNTSTLWQWFFNGVFQAFVVSGFAIFIMSSETSEGREGGVFILGQVMFATSIIIVNTKVLIFSNTQYLINIIVCILSFILYILGAIMFNFVKTNILYLEFSKLVKEPQTYYSFLLIFSLTCLLDYGHSTYLKCDYMIHVERALQVDPRYSKLLVQSTLENIQQNPHKISKSRKSKSSKVQSEDEFQIQEDHNN